jgi:hypothetical protein
MCKVLEINAEERQGRARKEIPQSTDMSQFPDHDSCNKYQIYLSRTTPGICE